MNDFQQIAEELARRVGEITARYEAEMSVLRVENSNQKAQITQLESAIREMRPTQVDKDAEA
jgi:hypothetical protein